MQLFYAPDNDPPEYTLSEEESKHCIRELRKACGEALHITDGRGNLYRCEIVAANPKRCRVRVRDTNSEFGKLPYLWDKLIAPSKNIDRFEGLLDNATEIGVAEFMPLASEHSERRTLKPERENKFITASVKQSLKAYHPRLHEITPLRQVIKQPFDGQNFIALCDAPRSALGKAFLPHILHKGGDGLGLIGPEGDFSPEESDLAVRGGFREITLGSQRLRTETAAVMATALVAAANKEQGRILREAMEERDKIVHEARKQAEIAAQKELDAVKQQIQMEKDEAIRDIRRQVAVLSVDIAEKVLRKSLEDKDAQMGMIDRMLDEVLTPNKN